MQVSLLLMIYVANALIVALIMMTSFLSDRTTSKKHTLSWVVVAIASLFWFIAIPLSFIEILRKSLHRRRVLRDQVLPSKTLS
ncbi:hypothetical protein [Egbenema bharatensis]|uniref:hypothetical protein n=1 Tax=Egbenema bharatensis TaxID=3463334 RepID=UPI003A878092